MVRAWQKPNQSFRRRRGAASAISSPIMPAFLVCRDGDEANYLLAIINSDVLQEAVQPFMSKGQFGARDLHKHLWKLPIPEYDPGSQLHVEITQAGASAANGAADQLATLLKSRGDSLTSTITRRELRSG